MEKEKSMDVRTANQAWRRKPRKFAPKSRLGCKTCKIRRIKCDLSQPSCLKCQSTGRTCDGYSGTPSISRTKIELGNYQVGKAVSAKKHDGYHPSTTISASKPKLGHAKHHGVILQNLGPFMVLPVTGPAQTEAICFFEFVSIKHLNEYYPCESWQKTLMFFSQTVPSVRHAAIALAMAHRKHLDRDYGGRMHHPKLIEDWLPDKSPLHHYNQAIQLLLNQEIGDSMNTTAITLLVCYLFICFDQTAGKYVQAIKHLRGGVELSCNIRKASLNSDDIHGDGKPSELRTLIFDITKKIRRLDMQAATFLIDWTPTDIQETIISQLSLPSSAFQSLEQAADYLQILVARAMRLCHTKKQMSSACEMPASPSTINDKVLGQLQMWSKLFENMLQQDSSYRSRSGTYPQISMLRLHHTIAWTLLCNDGSGREMDYDIFLAQFQQCVALAEDVATAHERYSGSLKLTVTPEIGIVPALYIIGAKCRHPVVRRKALEILRRQHMLEAVWDSVCAARVIERIIEIEEGRYEERRVIESMEQITVCQRIEAMSWVHLVDDDFVARVDIEYTFCTQEEKHNESLELRCPAL